MATPYDGKISAFFWKGSTVAEKTIDDLLDTLEAKTPNVRSIYVKSNNGVVWQGNNDVIAGDLNIFGPQDIARWVEKCSRRNFDVHLWCVVQGRHLDEEIATITSASLVPGVRSMIFDLEVGDDYFVGGRDGARKIASEVRRQVADDFHLSVCLDGRRTHPTAVFYQEWNPFVNSIQPMIYYDSFFPSLTEFDEVAKTSTEAIFSNLASFDRPILPIFPSRPAVKDTMLDVVNFALDRFNVQGYSLWRLGPGLFSKVFDQVKSLPLAVLSDDPTPIVTNQQILDAISKAAIFTNNDPQDWLRRADLSHIIDNRGGVYLGPSILTLPGLSDDQRQLILMALLGTTLSTSGLMRAPGIDVSGMEGDDTPPSYSNQQVINAFFKAAAALGDPDAVWQWFTQAKLNSILAHEVRSNPYVGPAIGELPKLSDEIKAKIQFFLDLDQTRPVLAGGTTAHTGVALRGANIDFGDNRFSPSNLAPFTCCRLVYDMSMETGNTDFGRAENRYHDKLSSYITAGITPILVLNHEFFGEGQGFNWDTMKDSSDATHARWVDLTTKFVSHLRNLVNVYKDRVVYEIWNESDSGSVAAVFVPERSFAHLLDQAVDTIRGISPNARVIVGGLVSGNAGYWHRTRSHMVNEDKFAGIGIHPYGQEDNGQSLVALLNRYANGSSAKFWLTEWGVLGDPAFSLPPNVPEAVVENYAKRFITAAKNDSRVAAIVWYGYSDGMHNGFGLVRADMTRKQLLWDTFTRGL